MSKKTSGQSLLVILLVMAVILTIGLAVASYSITDIKISQQEEESARAFSAAEAGIEEALKSWPGQEETKTVSIGEITANVSKKPQGGGPDFDFGGSKFPSGELANVWLIGHDENGGLNPAVHFSSSGGMTICWGEADSQDEPAALELALIYDKNGANDFKVIRQGYDPDGRVEGFDNPQDAGNCPSGFAFGQDIFLSEGEFDLGVADVPYLLRLKLLYNTESQPIAVRSADEDFPNQGECYESAASVESGVTRKVRQCKFYEAPPEIFDYVLFSTSASLEK